MNDGGFFVLLTISHFLPYRNLWHIHWQETWWEGAMPSKWKSENKNCGCWNETPRKSQNPEFSRRRNKQVMGSPWALIITAWKMQPQCQHELWILWDPGTPCLHLVPLVFCFCWQQRAGWFKVFAFLRAHLWLTTKYWVTAPLWFKLWWTFAYKWPKHPPQNKIFCPSDSTVWFRDKNTQSLLDEILAPASLLVP